MTTSPQTSASACTCNVCGHPLGDPIYESAGTLSVNSLCRLARKRIEAFYCTNCTHVQATPLDDVDQYYDQAYEFLITSEDEDDIYQIKDGETIYRIDHQLQTMLDKLNVPAGSKMLDFGCTKSATYKKLNQQRPDIVPHLFDISEMYIPFWRQFAKEENWSVYEPKPGWQGYFDIVSSFLVIELIPDLVTVLKRIRELIKPGGVYYALVSNTYSNPAQFIVADQVNHFSVDSLRYALTAAGFGPVEIDTESHLAAYVVQAYNSTSTEPRSVSPESATTTQAQAEELARFWSDVQSRIRAFEQAHADADRVAVYGSGVYGTFISTCLKDSDRVACFVDQSPYRQGKQQIGKPIVAPADLDPSIDVIYVGLRPQVARAAIESIDAFKHRSHRYFYF